MRGLQSVALLGTPTRASAWCGWAFLPRLKRGCLLPIFLWDCYPWAQGGTRSGTVAWGATAQLSARHDHWGWLVTEFRSQARLQTPSLRKCEKAATRI